MATPDNTLISRAEIDSIINAATGRFALVMDGKTIEQGSTGLRDVSGLLDPAKVQNIAAGQLLAIRVGFLVMVIMSVTPSVSGNVQITKSGIGTPFGVPVNSFDQMPNGTFGITTAANIYINPAVAGFRTQAIETFVTTAAWPTTLPGVEFGQPVVL